MKRSLKDTLSKNAPGEKDIQGDVKEIVERYSGMSETELMNVLLKETGRQKKEGKFDRTQVESGVNAILPMLNADQRRKLAEIMGRIDGQ